MSRADVGDILGGIVLILVVGVVIGFPIWIMSNSPNPVAQACQRAGGVVIQTRYTLHCLRKDVFIEVEP
jgi:hypothetical protein